ncbi:MAG: transposase, partial [Muricoprocola sp.]
NSTNEVALLDCIQRFFSKHHVSEILKKCNGTKEKGVPAISILRYKLGNIFVGRSMYMQQRTESFHEDFSKNIL